ncbi:MAG: hypothetical protein GXO80_03505 [Chlorobi bacterium]|nr:hypothetical protein [Chlorobiota bacterium]
METITIPKNEYFDLINLYFKIKQQISVITQYKTEKELFTELYNNKLELSEQAYAEGKVTEHNNFKKEVEQWKKMRK